jgi:rod shape-determining protein MreD
VSYYLGIPFLLLAALSEVAVAPMFRVAGLQPNLVLIILTAWLIARGQNEVYWLIPTGGFFLGLVDGAPLGTAIIAMAPLALLQDVRGSQLREGGLALAVIFIVIMTVVYHVVYLLMFTLEGQAASWVQAATRVIIPTALINAVVIVPVYWFLSLFSHELRRPTYA